VPAHCIGTNSLIRSGSKSPSVIAVVTMPGDGVDGDAAPRDLQRQCLAGADQARFRRRVIGLSAIADSATTDAMLTIRPTG
jgi:hypothetical protein